MICTLFNNNKKVIVNPKHVVDITEGAEKTYERDYPYSKVQIKDASGEYFVKVVESRSYIESKLKEEMSLYEQVH